MPGSDQSIDRRVCLVVGPLGSGKQALIDAALTMRSHLRRAPLVFCRTGENRPAMVGAVSQVEFREMLGAQSFLASWDSDGIRYGLPRSVLDAIQDCILLISATEAALPVLTRSFPSAPVIHINARADILHRRIAQTGLFNETEIEQQLVGAARFRPSGQNVILIDTSESIKKASREMLAALDTIASRALLERLQSPSAL